MRYFFLIYALVAILVVSIFGFRGDKFEQTPFRIFPDMDDMDRIDPQSESDFFSDGMGSRQPVDKTVPHGYSAVDKEAGLIDEKGFANSLSFYDTGMFDDKVFGDGLPVDELKLTEENAEAFLKRGETVFYVQCSRCHGESGNGKGVVASYGIPGVANLQTSKLPTGAIYDIIVHGRGGMGSLGHNVNVRDRWAAVAYVKALQYSRNAPLEQVKEAYEAGTKAK